MKKIFTLATAVLMTMVSMAADRRPSVTLQGGKNYEVFIDGRSVGSKQFVGNQYGQFGAQEISNLGNGKHTITVYEIPRRFFAIRSKRVVSTASFMLRGNDVAIKIDMAGKIQVKESKMNNRFDDRGWNSNDRDNDYDKGYDQGKDDHGSKDWNDRDQKDSKDIPKKRF